MLCHHYRCIFVHIPKCGGTSIEYVFLGLLGLDWKRRAPLLLRPNGNPDLGPPRLAHLSAGEYLQYKYVSPDMFSRYFKFTFVRDPWARAVSLYHSVGHRRYPDFRAFLSALCDGTEQKRRWFCKPQMDFIVDDNGELMVDFVGRLESMNDDFEAVAGRLELGEVEVPHRNRSRRIEKEQGISSYRDLYDDETLALVSEYYRRDIEFLGYRFRS
jgi:hypothetical protein